MRWLQQPVDLTLGNRGAVVAEAGDVHAPDRVVLQEGDTPAHCRLHQLKGMTVSSSAVGNSPSTRTRQALEFSPY